MKNEVLVVELRNPVEAFLMFGQREPAEECHTIGDHQLAYPLSRLTMMWSSEGDCPSSNRSHVVGVPDKRGSVRGSCRTRQRKIE